eukprot:CAMPEP_0181352422 /NCGR_PEP_ID=MMETSP1106-20121128/2299_1 /TAXON_ID=81844 /ORGANISM="Mantoniella antarctica, Strain SL-175" /LENGTH=145 /DNA_ID=CAMNT_0023464977 /DNA_START=882 /DNA_END=1319 /DNA_ORIENTATION=+
MSTRVPTGNRGWRCVGGPRQSTAASSGDIPTGATPYKPRFPKVQHKPVAASSSSILARMKVSRSLAALITTPIPQRDVYYPDAGHQASTWTSYGRTCNEPSSRPSVDQCLTIVPGAQTAPGVPGVRTSIITRVPTGNRRGGRADA